MKQDLLFIYIKANRISFLYYLFIAFVFLYGRLSVYPDYSYSVLLAGASLLTFAAVFVLRQQRLYRNILQRQSIGDEDIAPLMVRIGLNKLGYILPWLVILFYPFHTDNFSDHLFGYIYVCSAIALYASTSSASFRLFLWDAGIPAAFAAMITAINFYGASTYTYYISITLALLFAFALLIGRKINQSSVELVRKKYQLEEAMAKVAEASRAKSDFLAIMSHEIRTPMTGIMGMIGYLKDTKLNLEQKDCLETIDSCSATLLNTLNDVLDVSTIEAGKFAIEPTNFDLHKSISSVIKSVAPIAEVKSLLVFSEIDANLPRFIYADPNRLQQVLTNLLNNAVKFTESGSITLKASFKAEEARVRIEVTDTGIGVSSEDQDLLFEKFSQIKAAANRKYEGTGLGLAIAKSLVELMAGEIGVSSSEGQGATFWFEVPFIEPQAGGQEEDILEIERSFADMDILLVEDNPVNVMVVEKLLGNKVRRLLVARSGGAALEAAKANDFNLILMDLNLPDMDGIETVARIRGLGKKYVSVPIIALTANTVQENIADCYRAGMVGHLIKPYKPVELYLAIERYAAKGNGLTGKITGQNLGGKVDAMMAEFGPEYTKQFVTTAHENISNLLSALKEECVKVTPNYKAICQYAHDIKAVSGTLGMERTAKLSATIEQMADNNDGDVLSLATKLEIEISSENPESLVLSN